MTKDVVCGNGNCAAPRKKHKEMNRVSVSRENWKRVANCKDNVNLYLCIYDLLYFTLSYLILADSHILNCNWLMRSKI